MAAPTITRPAEVAPITGGVGTSAQRPDGIPKVDGSFIYSSDEYHDGSLWGVTLRSPHPRARIRSIDTSVAEGLDGVRCVLTHRDVPGSKTFGMKVYDQPVLATGEVRFQGEPVAVVAATHPEIGRRACQKIVVDYELLPAHTDPEASLKGDVDGLLGGGLVRHVKIRHGDVESARRQADVIIEGRYEMGTQDPAFLGPESTLAVPTGDGVELYVSCQNLHLDHQQIADCLGLPPNAVRLVLSGVGGAFGGKEDLNVQVHAAMMALRSGRPVRMSYGREESFFGHVHRHPAIADVELGARSDGRLAFTKVRLVLDGGAYTSTSQVVIANGCYFAAGAYDVPNVRIDGYATYTNNPPCGAMRGFGAVQSCYAIESAMDVLAQRLGMHPLELRMRNAIGEGDVLPTGQPVDGPAPVTEMLTYLRDLPLPDAAGGSLASSPEPLSVSVSAKRLTSPEPDSESSGLQQAGRVPNGDMRMLPGGVGNVTRGEGIRRGVGFALGMKAIGFSGGVDDTCTAQVTVWIRDGEPVAEVYCAAPELGQGIVTLEMQIARSELGINVVELRDKDTDIAESGASSASRQSWMTAGAVVGACDLVKQEILGRTRLILASRGDAASAAAGLGELELRGSWVCDAAGQELVRVAEVLGLESVSHSYTYRHRRTEAVDDEFGQGNAHVAFAYAAHRAVVDVDMELGLVKVVEIATAQDVGKAMNPVAVEGQIEGGTVQGLGLAVMEDLQITGGVVRNPSFTDYLIPTTLDVPPMRLKVFEFPHPDSPYGLNGVGEPPNLSSTPAIVNALRDATGLELARAPVRPEDLAAAHLTESG